MNITSDAYFAAIIIVPYAKPCYVGPRYNYNGTWLHICIYIYIYMIVYDPFVYTVSSRATYCHQLVSILAGWFIHRVGYHRDTRLYITPTDHKSLSLVIIPWQHKDVCWQKISLVSLYIVSNHNKFPPNSHKTHPIAGLQWLDMVCQWQAYFTSCLYNQHAVCNFL